MSNKDAVKGFFCFVLGLGLFLLVHSGCDRIVEDHRSFSSRSWHVDSVQTFVFHIAETQKEYCLKINIRYGRDYPFYNLYTRQILIGPAEKVIRPEERREWILFEEKTGVPNGKGLGGEYFFHAPLYENLSLQDTGKYVLRIRHTMRENPLEGIEGVGMSLLYQ
ncbi:MAG: gliding motility lipoprotein GldH [Cytophagales bacterium]|nr:gliding motility lipoprotein GldH [Cytophagales bacterium]